MKILNLKKITAGGHHGWYETDEGLIRKPLGDHIGKVIRKRDYFSPRFKPQFFKSQSWWERLINYLKRWLS